MAFGITSIDASAPRPGPRAVSSRALFLAATQTLPARPGVAAALPANGFVDLKLQQQSISRLQHQLHPPITHQKSHGKHSRDGRVKEGGLCCTAGITVLADANYSLRPSPDRRLRAQDNEGFGMVKSSHRAGCESVVILIYSAGVFSLGETNCSHIVTYIIGSLLYLPGDRL